MMTASSASSALSRSTATVLALTTLAAAYGTYYVYTSSISEEAATSLPSGGGLHRSNAVHRRRRHTTTDSMDDPSNLFVDDNGDDDENGENNGEGHVVGRTLTDGETVVEDDTYNDEYFWRGIRNQEPIPRNGQHIVQLLFRVSEDATRRNAYVHRGCQCNACGIVPIRGIRYRCSNCPDYDLCEGCESQGVHTKTHIFYKIKVPGPSFGPRNSQPVWYAGDPDAVQPSLSKEITTKLSRETGYERPELDAYWEQWTYMATTDWRDDPDDINLAMDRKTFERCLVPSGGYRHTSPSLIFDRMFAFYDTNRDDLISFPEFLHAVSYRKKKEKWAKIFEGYDIDEDGFVDRKDFLRLFRSYYVLCRQMHRDMLDGMEDQQSNSTHVQRLISGRQPLSSAFGPELYPGAPLPRTGEGKSTQLNGDLDIDDGNPVLRENGTDTGNREDNFRDLNMYLNLQDQANRVFGRTNSDYWDTLINPPTTVQQLTPIINRMRDNRSRGARNGSIRGFNTMNGHAAPASNVAIAEDDDGSPSESEQDPSDENSESWLPSFVTVKDEDAEAIDGPGTRVEDVLPESRRSVIAHAVYRERSNAQINERWKRRHFYTDEEEGATPPTGWKEEDDILVQAGILGESSKSQYRPSLHSRSSSKVRFAEDMDDFDTRSNPSTSSRSVPERWGGMEIPDAEKDAGKEILFQITQQAFNEILDSLFKEKEDLAVQAAESKENRDQNRHLFTTPEFEKYAHERQKHEGVEKERHAMHAVYETRTTESRPVWPSFREVEVDEVRQVPLEDLLAATGFEIDEVLENVEIERETSQENGNSQSGPSTESGPTEDDHGDRNQISAPADESPVVIPSQPLVEPTPSDSPSDVESTWSSHGSYHDPTLPQFRPNSVTYPLPDNSDAALSERRRYALDTPSDHRRSSSDQSSSPSMHPNQDIKVVLEERRNGLFDPEDTQNESEKDFRRDVLYHLWKCDRATKEAEERDGWGKLDCEEFQALVRRTARDNKAPQMDYLGSWIDFCIP